MPSTNLTAHMQRLKAFADNYEQTAESIIRAHSDDLADLQAAQLAKGIKSTGEEITPAYAPFTIQQKEKYGVGLGRVTSHVTAFSSGETYKLLQAKVNAGKYSIVADTYKYDLLEKRYGFKLFGLTLDSRLAFRDHVVVPEVQKSYETQVMR
jgi:hypothetical protein